MVAQRWKLHRRDREPTADEAGWTPKTLSVSEVVLTDLAERQERVLGRVVRHGGGGAQRWLDGFGFVPGGRYAWVVEGASWLGDRDYFMHLFPVEAPSASFQVICSDELGEGDLRFAADGGAVFSRRGHRFLAGGEWIERSPLPPEGTKERLDEWPEGLILLDDLAVPQGGQGLV
jgi:hypothetical protein